MAHIGEEFGLGAIGHLRARLLLEMTLGEIGELLRLGLQRLARLAQLGDRREEAPLGIHELLFMPFERGDVGADGDIAAVAGAALVDLQPAPVGQARLVGLGRALVGGGRIGVDHRFAVDDGARRPWRRVRNRRRPGACCRRGDCEDAGILNCRGRGGWRNPRGRRPRRSPRSPRAAAGRREREVVGQLLLFGDVDRDADEMRAGARVILDELGAGAQPDPFARGVADAEFVIHRLLLGARAPSWRSRRDCRRRDGPSPGDRRTTGNRTTVGMPSSSYIDRDQWMRPRARSQSQSPQRPRLSAMSTRLRARRAICSRSRARPI